MDDWRRGLVRNPLETFELEGGVLLGESCDDEENKGEAIGVVPMLVFEIVLASTR
jgi:hypothetical protein